MGCVRVAWSPVAHPLVGVGARPQILAGALEGDPAFSPVNQRPVAEADSPALSLHSTIVTLPQKTCNYCTIQFAWAARSDGGFYLGCADISVTANGESRDHAARHFLPAASHFRRTPLPARSRRTHFDRNHVAPIVRCKLASATHATADISSAPLASAPQASSPTLTICRPRP